eukprot:TRINITY_DN356_c0_g1_i1.p1 TRINITY_DN356_c0_g1~~TRINITY_DN356_c0_g1_i1.p1  ORF type:complete len:385 (-),score=122.26 TRINITY_DN356_c0_g1_i1:171-1160(-)
MFKATQKLEKLLPFVTETRDEHPDDYWLCLSNLYRACLHVGDAERAVHYIDMALDRVNPTVNKYRMLDVINHLSFALALTGDENTVATLEEARDFTKIDEIESDVGAHAMYNFGCWKLQESEFDEAQTYFNEALSILVNDDKSDEEFEFMASKGLMSKEDQLALGEGMKMRIMNRARVLLRHAEADLQKEPQNADDAAISTKKAIKLLEMFDQSDKAVQPYMYEALGLLARALHVSEKAVSSEGLYRSAIDSFNEVSKSTAFSNQQKLILGKLHLDYSLLLGDWENRGSESEQEKAKSKSLLSDEIPQVFRTMHLGSIGKWDVNDSTRW